MIKPKVLIFSGYGLNGETETAFAFELAGAKADIVHINDLIDGYYKLSNYQIIALPAGFSYGDDTGSGIAFANRIRNHLFDDLLRFIEMDRLIIGICNGFQIITNLGILPEVALLANSSARLVARWVDMKVEKNASPWLVGIDNLSMPVAHGEGRLYAPDIVLNKLQKNNQIVLRYFKGQTSSFQNYEANPNGSTDDIAGIINQTGRVLGLMPHPERAMFFNQLPHWTLLKQKYEKEGKQLPKFGPGIKIYQNAVNYFS